MNAETELDDFARMENGSTLVIQRRLPGPVERIWRYLTDSALRSTWLAAGEMDLMPGAPMELVWRNDNLSDPSDKRPAGFPEEERMKCHIISVDPMRLLSFAWGKGAVTIQLEPQGDSVLLTLTHTGLDDAKKRDATAAGWHMHLDVLGSRASDTPAASFWSGWVALRDTYAARLAG